MSFFGNISESRFKLKHSLDSDEEDEKDEVLDRGLDDEDLAAQEDTTLVRGLGVRGLGVRVVMGGMRMGKVKSC